MSHNAQRFAHALTAFLYSKDALNGAEAETVSSEEECCLSDAYGSAQDRLISTPASSVSDLRAKIEMVWSDTAAIPPPSTILAIMADLHRLTNHEPSRYFNAAEWLEWFQRWGGGWVERDGEIVLMIPDEANAESVMAGILFELDACDGRGLVWQLIRERSAKAA